MNTTSWHPDPTGRHTQRLWDGARWTMHVADLGVRGTDPVEPVDRLPTPKATDDHPVDHKILEGYLRYRDMVDLQDSGDIARLAGVLKTIGLSLKTGRSALAQAVGDASIRLAIVVTLRIGRRKVPALLLLLPDRVLLAWSSGGFNTFPTINAFASATTTFSLRDCTTSVNRDTPILTMQTPRLTVDAYVPKETRALGEHLLAVLGNRA